MMAGIVDRMSIPDNILDRIKTGLTNPSYLFYEFKNIYHRHVLNSGINIIQKDWDNLIILDACRYDLFKSQNTIDGDLSAVISPGSSTPEFLKRSFFGSSHPDIVYVSANPQVQRRNVDNSFYRMIKLWEDYWDDEIRSVHPSDVTDVSVEVAEKYPNKRLIVHFIQPHYPFIGKTGKNIQHGTVTGGGVISDDRDYDSIWTRLEKGDIDRSTVWKAYKENLDIALPEVERLVSHLYGKSVVTSDHGNSFGEGGIYGHPERKYLEPLVEVPWLEIENGPRKTIKQGSIDKYHSEASDNAQSRLKDLGYVE